MKQDESSFTAALAATARGLGGEILPEDARLVVDPYGVRFATGWLRFVVRHARKLSWLIERTLLTMQLRTRVIDDLLAAFLREGNTQVVILGAGFDCRAARFQGAQVFEVDHPATQARKRSIVDSAARYLPFDFEHKSVDEIPAALRALGHDSAKPTLTIWESVTMYLSDAAIDATVKTVTRYSSTGSVFVFSYFTPAALKGGGPIAWLIRKLLLKNAEPLVKAFDPTTLSEWASSRSLKLVADLSIRDLSRSMLPAKYQLTDDTLRFAVCRCVHGGGQAPALLEERE